METTAPKLDYSVCDTMSRDALPVIIVAAGNSTRMGEDKQFMTVSGVPVIAKTLMAFERSPYISRIILVTKQESIQKMQLIAEKYYISKLTDIIKGGESRGQSVACGIERLTEKEKKALVSDGARMFVTPRIIASCAEALKEHDGCLCAIKVQDTVKSVEGEKVKTTVDRSGLYLAQTPQGITVSIYKKAMASADISEFTDDASVLESQGADVVIVPGDRRNIKITTPEDLKLAQLLAREE